MMITSSKCRPRNNAQRFCLTVSPCQIRLSGFCNRSVDSACEARSGDRGKPGAAALVLTGGFALIDASRTRSVLDDEKKFYAKSYRTDARDQPRPRWRANFRAITARS